MNAQEWASKLNGREYGEELTDAEEEQIAEDGVVVFLGASDDLAEIYGAFGREEKSPTTIYLTKKGIYEPSCDNREDCPHETAITSGIKSKVQYHWAQQGYSWFIESSVKFWPFDIMEDGERYCRGIAIDVKDVE